MSAGADKVSVRASPTKPASGLINYTKELLRKTQTHPSRIRLMSRKNAALTGRLQDS